MKLVNSELISLLVCSVVASISCRGEVFVLEDRRAISGSGEWRGVQDFGVDPETGREMVQVSEGLWDQRRVAETEAGVFDSLIWGGMFGYVSATQTSQVSPSQFTGCGTLRFHLSNPFGEDSWVYASETAAIRSVFHVRFSVFSTQAYEYDGFVSASSPNDIATAGMIFKQEGAGTIFDGANGVPVHESGLLPVGTYDLLAWVEAVGDAGYKGESTTADGSYSFTFRVAAVPEVGPMALPVLACLVWVHAVRRRSEERS